MKVDKGSKAFLSFFLGFLILFALGLLVPSAYSWTPLEGHITQDTTLTLANSPYRLIGDVTVDRGVKLTVEPGVTIEFADGFSLIVNGTLYSVGTTDAIISFTSSRSTPSPGVWNTVIFTGGKMESFTLKYCTIKYAKNGITISTEGFVSIQKSVVSDNSENGILLVGKTNILIKENTIKNNKNGIGTDGANHAGIVVAGNNILSNKENGVYLNAGNPGIYNVTLVSNTVSSNGGNGVYLNAYNYNIYNVSFISNTVSSNGGNGVYLNANYNVYNVTFASNTVSSNTQNGIHLYASRYNVYNVSFASNTVSSNGGNGIHLYAYSYYAGNVYNVSFISNTVSSNTQNGIYLNAYYSGNVYNVSFASNTVSSNGGNGIHLYAPSNVYNVMCASNTVSLNGGNGVAISGNHLAQLVYDLKIVGNSITANTERGISIDRNTIANITRNSISYNKYGVFYTTTKNNVAKYNDIYRNTYGMNVTSGATVNAEYDYWGDTSGPYHLSLNPEGKGNRVNGNGVDLDFIPWLSAPNGQINERPVARLTADKTSITVGQTATFDASTSTDDGRVDKYLFNFGDGKNSGWITLSLAKHNYTSLGVYKANLTVVDDFGVKSTNTATWTISVVQTLQQLTVSVTINPTSVISGEQVSVKAHVTNGTKSVQGASVQFASDKGGTFSPASGLTNSTGDLTIDFTAPTVLGQTNVRITVTAAKAGYSDGSDYKYVSVLPEGTLPLSVTVTASPSIIQFSQTATLTVRVLAGTNPVTDATVALSSGQVGTLSPTSGSTNSSGYLTSIYTAPAITTQTAITIRANATKSGFLDGQGQTQITIQTATLSLAVTASPTSIQSGQTSTITTRVTFGGASLPEASVTLSSDGGGSLSPANGNTDSNGYFTATFTAPTVTTQTTITITASVTKSGYPNGQGQQRVTVNPSQPQPRPQQPDLSLWMYLGVVIMILIAVGGGVAIAKRGHKPK